MKKITLLLMAADKDSCLHSLQDLGTVQISGSRELSQNSQDCAAKLQIAMDAIATLDKCNANMADPMSKFSFVHSGELNGEQIAERIRSINLRQNKLSEDIRELEKRLAKLAIWGNYSLADYQSLQSQGINIKLCSGNKSQYLAAQKIDDVTVELLSENHKVFNFAVISLKPLSREILKKLPVFEFGPEDDPDQIKKLSAELSDEQTMLTNELNLLSQKKNLLVKYYENTADDLTLFQAADTMRNFDEIIILTGFIPEPELDSLRTLARESGWGLVVKDPAQDEQVPVLVKNSRLTRIIKPLMDFLGIVPGYHEIDISAAILVFFTIFYAIIVGDAGYGMLFAIISLCMFPAAKRKPALKMPLRLFMLLSIVTVIWGGLCGSYFGFSTIPGTDIKLPAWEKLRNFAGETAKQAYVQAFCFILAILQLSTGRLWKSIHEHNLKSLGENIGWMLILWGNFFLTIRLIVFPGDFPQFMYYLYGIGFILVCVCGVNWLNVVDVFQLPFSIINSFTDILSYIRLFAVGIAGACIASSFNDMALNLCSVSPWIIPLGIVVLLIGHLLNIGLCLMSVVVHAVRLNTLEFSSHSGLTWSGQQFNPFRKKSNQ